MERSGHIGCWILLASIIGYLTGLNLPVFLLLTSIGAFFVPLPDKDIEYERHRGGMHSLLFAVAVAAVAGGIGWIAWTLVPQKMTESLITITTLNSSLHVFTLVGGAVLCGPLIDVWCRHWLYQRQNILVKFLTVVSLLVGKYRSNLLSLFFKVLNHRSM